MCICLNRVKSIQENDKQNTSGATASAPTGDIRTLIEIRKHSQHVNEKQLWEQFHAEGEERELYFRVHPPEWGDKVDKGGVQPEGEETGAAEGKLDKDAVEEEAAWPFCGISGARHSIWRDMLPPCARMPRWSH